ncbi:flagellar motor protein MotB [Pseudothauera rhizosphaerae]|uniref:Flagellar motor protein MotB n=1 Tax=Pseudothauera rhizosphaerae TaxID=2565932 RepID=A0A4S4AN42_9RHOO|nr:flagellar motor protein MotB [Pseudothauera rhizosphaerae]THF60968.1 flagellar motor protein MotB [Pseudothauera rhizosphaerae]
MRDDSQQPIVVKRIRKGGGGAHGGVWKLAYADFVTAMMAFFLMMWLLGSTAQGDLEGIAEHFRTPIKFSMQGGAEDGGSSRVLQGGGDDLSRSVGQVRRGDVLERPPAPVEDVLARERRTESARLLDLKGRIEAIIEADPALRPFKNQILMDITLEGLRIQLVDEQNRPMFLSGSAILQPYTRDLLRAIGRALNDVPNRVSLSGHTDAAPYAGGERGFSNWELSSNRANTSRRELLAGGLDNGKVLRVVGLADTIHLNRDDPLDPANRRISIIVMKKQAEEAIRSEGGGAPGAGADGPGDGPVAPPAAIPGSPSTLIR